MSTSLIDEIELNFTSCDLRTLGGLRRTGLVALPIHTNIDDVDSSNNMLFLARVCARPPVKDRRVNDPTVSLSARIAISKIGWTRRVGRYYDEVVIAWKSASPVDDWTARMRY